MSLPKKRNVNNGKSRFILSSSPTSIDSASPPRSLGRSLDRDDISPSFTSGEIEVILDDGTLQRRKISLSSINDTQAAVSLSSSTTTTRQRPATSSRIDDRTPLLSFPDHTAMYMDHNSSASSYTSSSGEDDDECSSSSDDDNDDNDPRHRGYIGPKYALIWPKFDIRQKRVLKCSFAYFFASLFTFIPFLNNLIGHNRTSSHLVATATVFFNPAKTLGGMVEAAAYGWGYVLFALAICLGSMLTTDFFIDRNMYIIAHIFSLFVWLAGATFTVSYLKAYWNKPPVASASSLCFIIIFIIVVREGSANRGDFDITRIQEITSAVATGTIITVLCCILFWPESAVTKLKKDIEFVLDSYRVLLKLLTKTFTMDEDLPQFEANNELQKAIESHQDSFTALQKSLHEAKLELGCKKNSVQVAQEYDDVISCMHRLAQYVGGLRSSCGIQFERIGTRSDPERQAMSAGLHTKRKPKDRHDSDGIWNIRAGYHRRKFQDEIRRQKTMIDDHQLHRTMSTPQQTQYHHGHRHRRSGYQPQQHFNDIDEYNNSSNNKNNNNASLIEFIHIIRQPLKSLAYTCKRTLFHLQTDKGEKSTKKLKRNMTKAVTLFVIAQRHAVRNLYLHHQSSLAAGDVYVPGEDAFLVYFFAFNMIEFATELIHLVDSVDKLGQEITEPSGRWWFKWMHKKPALASPVYPDGHYNSTFVVYERNMAATLHTPIPSTRWRKLMLNIWAFTQLLKQQTIRYAIKATVGAIILATPLFLKSTGPWLRQWRMEWALITLMVVMNPTIGATNVIAVYRIFSTLLGVFAAALFYNLFPANIYILPILTWLFSIPNFWIILHHKHGKIGQFTLLAYNLVMLSKYNDRETNRITVELLAWQRFVAIIVGVLFGLFMSSYVWPYEARTELRKSLSDLLIQLGWVYRKLLAVYVQPPDVQSLSIRQERDIATQNFMALELKIQRSLSELAVLLSHAPNEFRLKGPFPVESYRLMLRSCRNIADKFLAMRTVIFKDAWIEQVHQDFILPVNKERREMAGDILLYFYLLASALRLKTPLPPTLPPAKPAWERLLKRLRELPVVRSQQMVELDNIYMFYYAYVTMMEDVIRELDKMGDCMKELFGSLVPQEEWLTLFPEDG
ncbi:Fusaric acid resistance protein-like-domain-containing protein [Phascolomyces articulosus]|uniref:Fusaric acid resistance protein-like-domain-containing protein n=1 Tax=Phascolomyces articulosus TaxID=60185 RepID=A0AAD5PI31_9FUNG|nr:Fusaric acid resistance protein-like-domain-containing protein [Phascolomyces articulosus]